MANKHADEHYDIAVVGGGPGGYTAAIRASQLGMKTVLVEKARLGGVCLNTGCIPTKALLRSAQYLRDAQDAHEHGIAWPGSPSIDIPRMVTRSRGIADKLSRGVAALLKKNNVRVLQGSARLGPRHETGRRDLNVEHADKSQLTLRATRVILATGARARTLEGLLADPARIWTSHDAITPQALPRSLLIVGSGAIGIEMACFYRALGCEVTVIELQDRILLTEDREISALAQQCFERQGIRFRLGVRVMSAVNAGQGIKLTLLGADRVEETLVAERAMQAVGIRGNVEDLGLEGTRVRVADTHVVTNAFNETDEPGIHAIGDLAGAPWLAHKASHEACICVEHIAGLPGTVAIDLRCVPNCIYSFPQVASLGLTEDQAKATNRPIRVGRHPFGANGKAAALGERQGLVKTIYAADTGELLGAQMIGPEVTELIHGMAVAMTLEATEAELMRTIFPHPTLSEALHESTLDAWGRALNH